MTTKVETHSIKATLKDILISLAIISFVAMLTFAVVAAGVGA